MEWIREKRTHEGVVLGFKLEHGARSLVDNHGARTTGNKICQQKREINCNQPCIAYCFIIMAPFPFCKHYYYVLGRKPVIREKNGKNCDFTVNALLELYYYSRKCYRLLLYHRQVYSTTAMTLHTSILFCSHDVYIV